MERARPEPPPQPRQPPRPTPPRPLRPAPPAQQPVEASTFRAAAAERPESPPVQATAAIAAVASSCGDASAAGAQAGTRRLLQVKKPEQVLLLPPSGPLLPQAPDEGAAAAAAAAVASSAQARLLQLRPELLLLPPPSAADEGPCRPELRSMQSRTLLVKAEKQELGAGLDLSVGSRRTTEAGPRASRAAKLDGTGKALDGRRGEEKKAKLEVEEASRDALKGGEGRSLLVGEGAIKTEEPDRLRDDCRLGTEAPSNGLVHGSKDALLAQPPSVLGPHQQDLRFPLTLHAVPPGARIQFQGPPPSELIRLSKVPLTPVPIKMQSLLEPSVKIETKDVPLTVLPSDAGIRRRGNLDFTLMSVLPTAEILAV